MILKSSFLEKVSLLSFVHLSGGGWGGMKALHNRRTKTLNFLVYHISGRILLRLVTFLLLIFSSLASRSSSVNCPSLMLSWLLLHFWIGLSVIWGVFLSRFLKCSFHFGSLSPLLKAFSFAPDVLFLLLTSFTICHSLRNCLFSTEFLLLSIWPWMYSKCPFWFFLLVLSRIS